MINWFNFLLAKVYEELDILLKLIHIDNKIEGNSYDINKLINFLKFYQNQRKKFYKNTANNILIERSSEALIKAISDNLNNNDINIIVLRNNLGLNKWLRQKYEEFIKENQINANIKIVITDHFKLTTGKVLIIGCAAFVEEMSKNSLIPSEIITEEEN